MVKRGHLNVPVIGVAKAGRNLEQFRQRAKDSLENPGGVGADAFGKLCSLSQLQGEGRLSISVVILKGADA